MITQPPLDEDSSLPGWTVAIAVLIGSAVLLYVAVA
jgi:hypothetical protein